MSMYLHAIPKGQSHIDFLSHIIFYQAASPGPISGTSHNYVKFCSNYSRKQRWIITINHTVDYRYGAGLYEFYAGR